MMTILLSIIRIYRLIFSSCSAPSCRFYPTCSHYAEQALIQHGIWVGSRLIVKRLLKCQPWGPSGIDLVPEKPTTSPIDVHH